MRVYQFRHQRAPAIVAAPSNRPDAHLIYEPMRELCEHAVAAALGAGASYADARVVVRRSQVVGTRNGRVERLDDQESEGIGVRVLVGGAWGFACDRRLDQGGAEAAAGKAVAFAKAAPGGHSRKLAPLEPAHGEFRTQVERDPFSVSVADKVDLCLRAEQALAHEDVKVTSASVRAQRELKFFVSSEGASTEQEMVECGGGIDAMAARDGQHAQHDEHGRTGHAQHGVSHLGDPTRAASPSAAASAHRKSAASRPRTSGTVARPPCTAARRRISAIAGPGTAAMASTASRNAGSTLIRSMRPWCQERRRRRLRVLVRPRAGCHDHPTERGPACSGD